MHSGFVTQSHQGPRPATQVQSPHITPSSPDPFNTARPLPTMLTASKGLLHILAHVNPISLCS